MEIATIQPTTTRQAFTAALLASATPYCVGVVDAQKGIPAMQDDRYTRDGDKAEYMQGYDDERTAQATQVVDSRQRMTGRLLTEAEMQAEAEDYESDMADRERHCRGMW